MEDLQSRVQLLISTKGMTNGEFAEKIGVQPSNISHVLSGRNKPSLDLVMKILARFQEVRTEWLINGQGTMTKEYSLFEMEGEKISVDEKIETSNESPVLAPGPVEEEILQPVEDEIVGSENKVVEKEEIKDEKPIYRKEAEGVQKKNPHKKQAKPIERIVVFYKDKTFSEYYPED